MITGYAPYHCFKDMSLKSRIRSETSRFVLLVQEIGWPKIVFFKFSDSIVSSYFPEQLTFPNPCSPLISALTHR